MGKQERGEGVPLTCKESLDDRCWIGQASCLYENGVHLLLALEELGQDADEIASDFAADASIVQLYESTINAHP